MRPEGVAARQWCLAGSCLLLLASTAHAETAWLKDELRVNLRTGPGVQYRILGSLETGDEVQILTRKQEWTQVRPQKLATGWIPAGYLRPTPPARVALAEHAAENAALEERLAALIASESRLRADREAISGRDEAQQAEIARLERENLELRVGTRWLEWLTGAGMVLLGMALGAIVARGSSRRRQHRIRL